MIPKITSTPYPPEDMDGKTVVFRFQVAEDRIASGNGVIRAAKIADGKFDVAINVDDWPHSGLGAVKCHEVALNQYVTDLIEKAPADSAYEFECIDHQIPPE